MDQHNYIRQRMRELGRLHVQLRINEGSGDKTLGDFIINPQGFRKVENACKTIWGFDADTNLYTVPSLALRIGHSIKNALELQKTGHWRMTIQDV